MFQVQQSIINPCHNGEHGTNEPFVDKKGYTWHIHWDENILYL
jgi:hypothetical protein